jgi:hypothetical protein
VSVFEIGISLSGYVLSITGVTLLASMCCFRNCRFYLFGFTVKLAIFWLTNGLSLTPVLHPLWCPKDQRPSRSLLSRPVVSSVVCCACEVPLLLQFSVGLNPKIEVLSRAQLSARGPSTSPGDDGVGIPLLGQLPEFAGRLPVLL